MVLRKKGLAEEALKRFLNLKGILIHFLKLAHRKLVYHLCCPPWSRGTYLDDLKPAITSMSKFSLVESACRLFEDSSGCFLCTY